MKNNQKVYLAIPLSAKKDREQWARVSELLALTIGSLQNQSSGNFVALVCGHDAPPCLAKSDLRGVEFLPVDFARPKSALEGRRDKNRKRRAIAVEVRRRGGGYFMYLDADDLLHRDVVRTVSEDDNGVGYLITRGYVLDYGNKRLAAVPGVWQKRFDEVCGSSGIIFYGRKDLPSAGYPEEVDQNLLFSKIRNHTEFAAAVIRNGRKLAPLEFPAAIYSVNNSINISNTLVRSEQRQKQLIDKIAERRITELDPIRRDFALGDLI
jgi:hypothetical protein